MPKITEVYAFIAQEGGPDDEGIVACQVGAMMWPLIAGDEARVDFLRDMAQKVANQTGLRQTLARFTLREELETITPQGLQ